MDHETLITYKSINQVVYSAGSLLFHKCLKKIDQFSGKHKVVEKYLAEDIAAGRVETLAQKQAKETAVEAIGAMAVTSNNPVSIGNPVVPSVVNPVVNPVIDPVGNPVDQASTSKTLPSFEATTLELQNHNLDLTLQGFDDPHARINFNDFLNDPEAGVMAPDRIMQVNIQKTRLKNFRTRPRGKSVIGKI